MGATMRLIAVVLTYGILTSFAYGEETEYALSAANTKIEWTATKPDGKHKGGFRKLKGSAVVADDSLRVNVDIDCASLYADVDKLTKHLKSPDFFSVKEFPTASFKSTSIEKKSKGYQVTGDLTLHGKTKEITFPANIVTKGKFSLSGNVTINRQDFGLSYGPGKIDDDVAIRLRVDVKGPAK
jgi:polyisoprenoid-binding protein YceI